MTDLVIGTLSDGLLTICQSYGYVTHKPKAAIYLVAHSYQWKADLLIYKIGTRWSVDKNMIYSQSIDREMIDI